MEQGNLMRAKIAHFVNEYRRERGYPPTYQEVANHVERAKSVVHYHIRILEREGKATYERGKTRTLDIHA